MLVFSNAKTTLKETILTTALTGSGGVPVGSIYGLTASVAPGTGNLFVDFDASYYGTDISSNAEQPVTLYDDTGWFEEAFLVDRSVDLLTFRRTKPGNADVVLPTLPIGTKIAPLLSARTLKMFLQNAFPFNVGGQNITPDSGVTKDDSQTIKLGNNSLATKPYSAAFGHYARCAVYYSLGIGGYPVIAKDDDKRGAENEMTGMEGAISSISMSMAGGIAWAANTVYKHGTVFRSNPDNGLQWTLYCSSPASDQTQAESTTTEPSWSDFDWDYADMDFTPAHPSDWAYMVSTDWEGAGYDLYFANGMTFYPTELIFVCDEWSAITVAPHITVKVGSTTVLNNVAVDGITGPHQIKRWSLTSNVGVVGAPGELGINIKVNTRATGTKMQGRFVVKGIFLEDMYNTPLSQYMG